MGSLIPAVTLGAKLEPYKKLLGILVRKDCVSLALSNPYLTLAEPLGGLMLREGKLSARALQRMLKDQQLSGYVIACEVDAEHKLPDPQQQHYWQPVSKQQQKQQVLEQQQTQQLTNELQQHAVQQLQGALASISPALVGGWYGSWSAAGASCRIMPPGGPAAAVVGAGDSDGISLPIQASRHREEQPKHDNGSLHAAGPLNSSGNVAGEQRCSLGQQFLQDYLDSLGSLNTFG